MLAPLELQKPIELVQGLLGLPWSQVRSSISSAAKEEGPAMEILFPRASELHKAGVRFCIADHITSINFDPNTVSFYLPLIRINVNSEVIIRNLVVYEALIKSEKEPMILNWFVQLMNWLIQTAEDVKVLKDQGIILTLDSIDDVQVAKIFGGMNKSVKLTNTPDNLVNAVRSVKNYYNHLWRVSAFKFMNKWRQTVWKWCKIFSVLLILLLMSIQTFCSVYECPRFSFKVSNASQAQQRLQLPSLRSSL
ncbi:hypothetical protein TIFTF001_046686 [Ficus carica]|uniref:Uncharacterized protein n=1 Tax=Ficus carica TaxID=3494 RepID=A0AA87ZWF3_FICCA|nr:hypothetical protein TIFTF001_046684 [Ficus carica]GMN33241.1 hypothetical protein TIFTF001_046686 [Ficus carica]